MQEIAYPVSTAQGLFLLAGYFLRLAKMFSGRIESKLTSGHGETRDTRNNHTHTHTLTQTQNEREKEEKEERERRERREGRERRESREEKGEERYGYIYPFSHNYIHRH